MSCHVLAICAVLAAILPSIYCLRRLDELALIPEWDNIVQEYHNQPQTAPISVMDGRSTYPVSIPCPGDCNRDAGRGTCNWMTGECSCTLGWKGSSCDEVDTHPCNNPDGRWTLTYCFSRCERQRCYCGPGTKHPERPLSEGSFLEAEDAYIRAVTTHDMSLVSQWDINVTSTRGLHVAWIGRHSRVGNTVITASTVQEYCDADDDQGHRWEISHLFPCWYPEQVGPLCGIRLPSICVNQCSGHGACDRGFCVCEQGYFGVDCSIPVRSPGRGESRGGVPGHSNNRRLLGSRHGMRCTGMCSGHGNCNMGTCVCDPGYIGENCSMPLDFWDQDHSGGSYKEPAGTGQGQGHEQGQGQGQGQEGQGMERMPAGAMLPKVSRQELRKAALKAAASAAATAARSVDSASTASSAQASSSPVSAGHGGGMGGSPGGGFDSSGHGEGGRGMLRRGAGAESSTNGNDGWGPVTVSGGAGKAKRPLIFVYELPPVFTVRSFQFRRLMMCTSREFMTASPPQMFFSEWLYNFDFMFLEWVLHSEHRTLDPEEADYFFVPYLNSCYNFLGDDSPRHRLINGYRMMATVQAAKLVHHYIKTHFPYWDRNNGTDHIWTWLWDEGAAAAPAVIRNSIMVTSWGGKYVEPRTAYLGDKYIRDEGYRHDHTLTGMAFQDEPISFDASEAQRRKFNPRGITWAGDEEERGGMPGYDPDKDIVLPAPYFAWMTSPYSLYNRARKGSDAYEGSPGPCVGCLKFNHDKLFYFGGNLGREAHERAGAPGGRVEAAYSWGVRQTLAKYYLGEEGRSKGMWLYPGNSDHYLEDMAHSVFCGALPGDGWSHGYVRALLHGCIPVIIMDDVDAALSNIIDYKQLSLRVRERDIPNLHKILAAVPQELIDRMQANIHRIWPRFVYRRYRIDVNARMERLGYSVVAMKGQLAEDHQFEGENLGSDAMDTMLELLYVRLKKREQGLGNRG
eukprot:jgi/Mesvir1/8699/Mv02635-RA.1